MRHREDYRAAGVPMLPAVASERHVARQIVLYTWLTVFATLLLALASGWPYGVIALLAGAWLLMMAHRLNARVHRDESAEPLRLFNMSNSYLTVVFCAISVDSVLALRTMLGK
jgi:protoheme IX farnesyltransferase